MIKTIKRIGHKVKGIVRRIGVKAKELSSKIGNKIKDVSKIVDLGGRVVSGVGSALAPILTAINPALGAGAATISAGAGQISRIARSVGTKSQAATALVDQLADRGIELVQQAENRVIRTGRKALQDNATTVANMRSLSKAIGGGNLSIRQAFKEAQELGMSKVRMAKNLRDSLDLSKLRPDQLLRLDRRFI